jgi:hypothetical protein
VGGQQRGPEDGVLRGFGAWGFGRDGVREPLGPKSAQAFRPLEPRPLTERVRQILFQILHIFDSDGDSNQRIRDPYRGTSVGWN